MNDKNTEISSLREELDKTNAELNAVKISYDLSQKKINFTRKATEDLLIDSISNNSGYREDSVVIGVYSATLNEDDFEIDEESEEIRSHKDQFLKSIEAKIDPTSSDQKERFMEVRNKILNKVKTNKVSRCRTRSGSSVGSPSNRKRSLSSPKAR